MFFFEIHRVFVFMCATAGSIDFVGRCKDGSYALYDWKRVQNLTDKQKSAYGEKGK
jgi:hypothetical protein